jgi:hypothetical protein
LVTARLKGIAEESSLLRERLEVLEREQERERDGGPKLGEEEGEGRVV